MSVPDLTATDYTKFFAAGALCCTVTHGAATPIDVIKTRIQVDPSLAKTNMLRAGMSIVQKGGTGALLTGFGPTAVGYLVQGGAKFSGFEAAKLGLVKAAGGYDNAVPLRMPIYLVGASIAEFFADILLTPLEATRIRLVSNPSYASGLASGFAKLARTEGFSGMYSGFVPILAKQIPYAVGQFATQEYVTELVYGSMSPSTKESLSATSTTAITLGCGIVSGCVAAVISQPGDTLLSMINKGEDPNAPKGVEKESNAAKLVRFSKELGFKGLFSGLTPRLFMTAFLVSGQFGIYGAIKESLGATKSVVIRKGSD